MRIPTTTVELEPLGYEGYWIKMPKSVTEGWLYDFQKLNDGADLDAERVRSNPDEARKSMLMLLELVPEWNLDDDGGKVLPLIKTLKDPEKRSEVISQLPIDIIVHLSKQLTKNIEVPEQTADFSNGSSAPPSAG